jgi:hypothetical protein
MIHKRERVGRDRIACKEQKGFIKNINGCCGHSAGINFLINHAIVNKKVCI